MTLVPTMRGEVASDVLGRTLMHEHVFVLNTEVQSNYRTEFDEAAAIDDAVLRLDELCAAGVSTIVDLTVVGLGRYVPRLAQVAARTRLNIVVATGLYTYDTLPHFFDLRGDDEMVAMWVHDLTEGITDTGVRAAILKCATDHQGVTPGVERVLRTVARAQRETGAPISTHTHAGSEQGLAQQRIFVEEGVDLGRVIIGHSGDTTDLDYLQRLLDSGSYLGMDRFGIDVYLPFEQRVDTVAALCARGYAERLVLSHDAACHIDWVPEKFRASQPNWHYLHITNDVLPALRERGVTESQIDEMLIDNPRRIFEGAT